MPHTENYCLEKIFELLHVLINQHHIPILFSFVDSNNIVQTFGSKHLKEKWTNTWQNSNSWKRTFQDDKNELNSSSSDVLEGLPTDALRNHQQDTQPHPLPMPITTMNHRELCDWLMEEIRREHIKKFNNPSARVLLKMPEFEPPWWMNSKWSWDSIKKALRDAKFDGPIGEKTAFLREQAKECLQFYNISPDDHVIPTYSRAEHKIRMKNKYKIVVDEDEHTTPLSSANNSVLSSSDHANSPTPAASIPATTTTSITTNSPPPATTTTLTTASTNSPPPPSIPATITASATTDSPHPATTTASTTTTQAIIPATITSSTTTTIPLTTLTSTSTSVGSLTCTDQDLQNTSFPSTSLVQSLQYDDNNLPVLRVSSDLTAIQVNPVPNVSRSSPPMLRSSSRTQTTSRSLTQMTGASSTDGRGPTLTSSPPSVRGLVPNASSDSSSSTSSKSHRSGPRSPASTVPGNRVSRSPSPTSPQTRVTSALPPSSPPPRAPPRTVSVTPPPPASPFQLSGEKLLIN